MLSLIIGSALAQQPWQVGPSPSASPAEKGLAFAAHGTVWGDLRGGRVTAAFAPSKRFWFQGEVGSGTGYRRCPDCSTTAFTGTGRVQVLNGETVRLGAWGLVTAAGDEPDFGVGAAMEIGRGRFRVDASVPFWSSQETWAPLVMAPELGAQWQWTKRQTTRVALVGIDPNIAATHRVRLGIFGFEATAAMGRSGPTLEAGARLQF